MRDFLDFQVQFVLLVQSLGVWLELPMKIFTFLGNEEFYLLIAPALYWCVNRAAGLRFGIYLMLSSSLNAFGKFAVHSPRPFWVSDQIKAVTLETSFGIPSGHSQNAVVVFGSLLKTYRKKIGWILVPLIALLIGFSRMVLGVHFLIDVLSGWLVGAILLWFAFTYETKIISWFNRCSLATRYWLILAVSISVILIGWLLIVLNKGWVFPHEWYFNAVNALGIEVLQPYHLAGLITNSGAFCGLAWGVVFLSRSGGFDPTGTPIQKFARYIIGLLGVLVFYKGLDIIFPEGDDLIAYIFRFVRYGLVGLWISALGPMVFRKLKISN